MAKNKTLWVFWMWVAAMGIFTLAQAQISPKKKANVGLNVYVLKAPKAKNFDPNATWTSTKGKWIKIAGQWKFVPSPAQTKIWQTELTKDIKSEPNAHLPLEAFRVRLQKQEVFVEWHSQKENIQIAVYDLIGKKVFHGEYKNFKNQQVQLPSQQWASGRYFVKIESEGKTTYKAFTL